MKSCHFYRIAQCSSKYSMTLLSFSMTFPWLSLTFAIFHDFPGLEMVFLNSMTFHDQGAPCYSHEIFLEEIWILRASLAKPWRVTSRWWDQSALRYGWYRWILKQASIKKVEIKTTRTVVWYSSNTETCSDADWQSQYPALVADELCIASYC